eukprot:TRINITY_DN29372_c0_g1_i1.p1 TRINITY_DN29372_c0_g1~~TRINITY_DN29372_c0_g1_i1.p1  ORF type:complete len:408 (+),score=101.63 TRINITY_DN29372_c0_g1_i1:73-1224(+)
MAAVPASVPPNLPHDPLGARLLREYGLRPPPRPAEQPPAAEGAAWPLRGDPLDAACLATARRGAAQVQVFPGLRLARPLLVRLPAAAAGRVAVAPLRVTVGAGAGVRLWLVAPPPEAAGWTHASVAVDAGAGAACSVCLLPHAAAPLPRSALGPAAAAARSALARAARATLPRRARARRRTPACSSAVSLLLAEGAAGEVTGGCVGERAAQRDTVAASLGRGAELAVHVASALRGRASHTVQTRVAHRGRGARSTQMVRAVAIGSGAEFDGGARTDAEPGAAEGRVTQSLRALALPGADGEAGRCTLRPQLNLCPDKIEATHGAALGGLPREQLHYLSSRGIPRGEAARMLTAAEMSAVLRHLPQPLEALLRARLAEPPAAPR